MIRLRGCARYYMFVSIMSLVVSAATTLLLLFRWDFGIGALIIGDVVRFGCIVLLITPVFVRNTKARIRIGALKAPLSFG